MWWCMLALAEPTGMGMLETEHHTVWYPAEAEPWVRHVGARLEGIRAAVEAEVGVQIPGKTTVLIRDPYGRTDGVALPTGRRPTLEIWAHAPASDEPLAGPGDWSDRLFAHEMAHLAQLSTPPRQPGARVLYRLFGMGPLVRRTPHWLGEGYATLVESRVTGSGRVQSAYRATVLRRLAQEGLLPHYSRLSGDDRTHGELFPVLVASAYLGWLEERGYGRINDLFARMSAADGPSFGEAFRAVFGEPAADLYRRFGAELTADAMKADGADYRRASWMDPAGETGRPAISPAGDQLAVVLELPGQPASLRVYRTASDSKAITQRHTREEKRLAADPEDVPFVHLDTPRELLATRTSRTFIPRDPTWRDASHVVFSATSIQPDGRTGWDLFELDVAGDTVRRLTRNADLVRATIGADPMRAVAVHSRFGLTNLVEVQLDTGVVTPLRPADPSCTVDQPALAADGRLAWLQNCGEGFVPVIDGVVQVLPEGAQAAGLAWTHDQAGLLVSLHHHGRFDIWQMEPEGAIRRTDTGGALAPAASPDGLYHLELNGRGRAIHQVTAGSARFVQPGAVQGLASAGTPLPLPMPESPVAIARAGFGRGDVRLLAGGMASTTSNSMELGVRLSEVTGRHDLALLGAVGDPSGVTGLGAWYVNRTRPTGLHTRAWFLQRDLIGVPRLGGSLMLERERDSSTTRLEGQVGAWGEVARDGGRGAVFSRLGAGWLEPSSRALWMWGEAYGSAGVEEGAKALGGLSLGMDVGRDWALSLQGDLRVRSGGRLALGGLQSSLLPSAAEWSRVRLGWLPFNAGVGPTALTGRVGVGRDGVEMMVERSAIGSPAGLVGWTFAGVTIQLENEREPLVGLAHLSLETGVGCLVEQGGRVPSTACQRFRDYRTWTRLTWRP